jgi:prophage regulatory protein
MARPKITGAAILQRAVPPPQVLLSNTVDEDDRLLDVKTLVAMLSCSESLIYRMIRDGEFPAPIRLGKLTRWRLRDYRKWMARSIKKGM